MRRTLLILTASWLASGASERLSECAAQPTAAESAAGKSVDDLPEIEQLANPFVFNDGSQVKNEADWARRRGELKELFERYEYGSLPPKPETMNVTREEVKSHDADRATVEDWAIHLEHAGKSFTLHCRLTLPSQSREPVPVVIQGAFPGFGRRRGPAGNPPGPPPNRLGIFTDRGYAVAECRFNDVAPDNREAARDGGIYELFGRDIDCGALMAWAWATHRVIDALEEDDRIDANKIIVTGHSRYGKAALVAGAFDERIALTVPSHSGCAGTAPFRFIYGNSEQLHNIVGAFPYWFRPDFNQFVGKVERLPVDQHLLRALVAPRALLATEGTEDAWTNPEGSQLAHLAAKQVYDFLGAGKRISIRTRPVGHIPSNEDLLEFADHVFFDKPLSKEFGELAYPEEANGFDWRAPR
jgi:hypothetical protein